VLLDHEMRGIGIVLSNHRIGKPSIRMSCARAFIAGDAMTWCCT
jgi:hypothetical protein